MKSAKILVTLGPASREPAVIEALLGAGADGVRVNMSHGTHEEKAADILMARNAAAKLGHPLAVLVDLSGPKIRTGTLADSEPVALQAGSLFTLTTRPVIGNHERVSTNYPDLPRVVPPGARLLLDDGAIALVVESTTETDVTCRVINGGVLAERKGINLPGISLPIDSLTEKDIVDLRWAVQQNADYIALSFVRSADDCIRAKSMIAEAGGHAPLVAKIEKAEAIDHLDAIIAVADAVMVARGDLGVETRQSMVTNPRPTRAEASDVANAVWDGTDCLMLSNETATGQYPVPAVATMARIIASAESARETDSTRVGPLSRRQSGRVSRALCEAATFAAEEMGTRVTAVFTQSGLMARRLSSLRPPQRIIALTQSPEVQRELALIWGVESLITEPAESTEEMLKAGEQSLLQAGVVRKGEMIVVMAGRLSGLGLSSSVTLFEVAGSSAPTVTENTSDVSR